MRDRVASALEVVGIAAVTAGVALVYTPAAFIVGGLGAIGLAYGLTRGSPGACYSAVRSPDPECRSSRCGRRIR